MLARFRTTVSQLTPGQALAVTALFWMTSIGAVLLAWWFVRRNKKRYQMETET